MDDLERATLLVDQAWGRLKADQSFDNQAAYDRAFADWKRLGIGRGVGRPPSSDQAALSSSERAREARARQQQSAERWERVAPHIQKLRGAVRATDRPAIEAIANALVRETEMVVSDVRVIHAQPDSDFVVLHGWHGKQIVLAFIPRVHLDDYFRRRHMSGREANLVVDRNIEAFARMISTKYERGQYRPYSRFGSTMPRIDITLEDIEQCGEKLTDSLLDLKPMWVSHNGRTSPG